MFEVGLQTLNIGAEDGLGDEIKIRHAYPFLHVIKKRPRATYAFGEKHSLRDFWKVVHTQIVG